MKLVNKIIVITGASSGIGEACAYACAEEGAKLILIARRQTKLLELQQNLLKQFNTKVFIICLDIQNKIAVDQAFDTLPVEWSNIDILINNAGLAIKKDSFQVAELNDLECMINTNLKGLIYITKKIIPSMIARNIGHIVNLGSISGHETYAGGTTYCATKFAITGFTSALKKDLLDTNIRVTLISPGIVKTEFSKVRFNNDIEQAEKVYNGMQPLTANDVADSILFCVTRPMHVNISEVIILPVAQGSVDLIYRKT